MYRLLDVVSAGRPGRGPAHLLVESSQDSLGLWTRGMAQAWPSTSQSAS